MSAMRRYDDNGRPYWQPVDDGIAPTRRPWSGTIHGELPTGVPFVITPEQRARASAKQRAYEERKRAGKA